MASPVLGHLYPSHTTLLAFLQTNLRYPDHLVQPNDQPAYRTLLENIIVALDSDYVRPLTKWVPLIEGKDVSSSNVDRRTVGEIIDRAIFTIFENSPNGRPSNQLTNGFTSSEFVFNKPKSQLPWNPNRPGIYAKQINTNLQSFETASWRLLLLRIGPDLFHHLLCKTSLFTQLPNQCLSQLTGTPVTDLKPNPSPSTHPVKKRKPAPKSESTSDEPALKKPRTSKIRPKKNQNRDGKPLEIEGLVDEAQRRGTTFPPLASDVIMIDHDDDEVQEMKSPQPLEKLKRKRSVSEPTTMLTPMDIKFARSRMMYGRPSKRDTKLASQKKIIVGFPPNHILGSLPPLPPSNPVPPATIQRVLMHIFPLQFSLPSPFVKVTARAPESAPLEFIPLSVEIEKLRAAKGGKLKTPEGRMKNKMLRELVQKLLRNVGQVDFWRWRATCCPSEVRTPSVVEKGEELSDETIDLPLEFVTPTPQSHPAPSQPGPSYSLSKSSNEPLVIYTQRIPEPFEFVDEGVSRLPVPEASAGGLHKGTAKFQKFVQPVGQVCRFATGVIKQVIPIELFGGEFNQHLVLKNVEKFIKLRRYETMTLHSVLQGFSMTECQWPEPGGFVRGSRISEGDAKKRRELMSEFLFWFFDGFLIPLLKTNFYITESTSFKKEVVYFRQDDWECLCRPIYQRLRLTAYKEVKEDEVNRTYTGERRKLGHSYVRLLPKENGVRPIINLRRKPKAPLPDEKVLWDRPSKSINSTLKETFGILALRKDTGPNLFGSSILGADEIYPKIKEFKQRTVLENTKTPDFYFAKVDVRSCFDTIDQDMLMRVLNDVFNDDEDYQVYRYSKAKLSGGQIKKRFMQQAFSEFDAPCFPQLAETLSNSSRKEIFMDKVYGTSHTRHQALSLLREHITDNLIRIGPRFFRQIQGIPQGSVVSTHLCSFFYADMEKEHLSFTSDPDCMLVRLVDDFLLISTSKSKATRFVRTMHAGHPKYGCFVSREKTLVNFECRVDGELEGPAVTLSTDFPWCGRLISTVSLEIKGDYTRDYIHIKNSLTVDNGKNPGLALRAKVLRNVAQKSPIVFNDTSLNGLPTVYLNIYQNLVYCAMKTVNYVKELGFDSNLHSPFLFKLINEAGEFTFNTIINGARKPTALLHQAKVGINPTIITWLSKHAFMKVLAKKPTLFYELSKKLEKDVQGLSIKGGRVQDQLQDVVSLGWDGMKMIKY